MVKLRSFLTIVALSLGVVVGGFAYFTDYLSVRFFNSAEWKAADYWSGERVQMVEHLKWSGELDGLDRNSVIALLGPETDTSYFAEHDLVYVLGSERGFMSVDSEWLVIDFDDEGVVESYQVVTD